MRFGIVDRWINGCGQVNVRAGDAGDARGDVYTTRQANEIGLLLYGNTLLK